MKLKKGVGGRLSQAAVSFREWPAFSAPVRAQPGERVSYRPVLLASGQGFKPEVKNGILGSHISQPTLPGHSIRGWGHD